MTVITALAIGFIAGGLVFGALAYSHGHVNGFADAILELEEEEDARLQDQMDR